MKKSILITILAALMLFAFSACQNAPTGMVMTVEATQTAVYVEGETPSPEGFTFSGYTNYGETVDVSADDISFGDPTGDKYPINFKGRSVGSVTVDFEPVTGYEVNAAEAVTEYYASVTGADYGTGRELSKTGLVVTAKYDGGEKVLDNDLITLESDVTKGITDPSESAKAAWSKGTWSVTVKFGTKEAGKYDIKVVDNFVKSIAVKTTENYVVYFNGETSTTTDTPDYVDNPTVEGAKGYYIEKEYEGGEAVVIAEAALTSSIQYQNGSAYQNNFPTNLIPQTATGGSLTTNVKYVGSDCAVGVSDTAVLSLTWVKNTVASVEVTSTPTTVSKATGFSAAGFAVSGKMANGDNLTVNPALGYWDGVTGEAPENYVRVVEDPSTTTYEVGRRYNFTFTGSVEGKPISGTFTAVVNA